MSGGLKACAHCGGRGEMDQFSPDAMDEWRVICADKSCEAWGPEASTRDAAITAWNRRAPAWEGIETAPMNQEVDLWMVDRIAGIEWREPDAEQDENGWFIVDLERGREPVGFGDIQVPTHWRERPDAPLPAAPADGGK